MFPPGDSFPPGTNSSSSNSSNPFLLSDDEADSYWARAKCRVPNCDQDAAKGNVACTHHLMGLVPKSARNSDRLSFESHRPVQSNGARIPHEPVVSANRKTLEAKATARKTANKRRPLYPGERILNAQMSAELRSGHLSSKITSQRAVNSRSPPIEGSANKKQRAISPTFDGAGFNSAPFPSPLALPKAFAYDGKQNGASNAVPSQLPRFHDDLQMMDTNTTKAQENPLSAPSSYTEYLRTPLSNSIPGVRPQLPRLNEEPRPSLDEEPTGIASWGSSGDEANANNVSINASIEEAQPFKAPLAKLEGNKEISVKTTPTKTKASQSETMSASRSSKARPAASTPPLERQRRRLVEEKDTSILDSYIYGQQGSSQVVPPMVEKRCDQQGRQVQEGHVRFDHLDPRTHRTRPHSEAWYLQKEEEIKARGGRKANLESPEDFEESLPDRVRNNENWNSMIEQPAAAPATPVRTKRPYVRRKPVGH
ncbi:hypothetical protein M406DRAFT_334206 [Cryphonectria parasitica EP155]|uniref:Uncharacterized protein n=1 Tax=Cryphonectria parasitica (strain ATCC 38755 / EP155) TaxID=660469 RepID=A0A9P4XTB3_CRYP1|nr:uncharacterized protein M406DRAFT_334206 [Cryphonectria parasitica EP155]KAF3760574.1 hypothetical protein M406DRAFT_334206 [Cryphonectria parasitica EP155]